MNPETISIPDCTLDDPVKKSSGKYHFVLFPVCITAKDSK